MTLPPRPFAGRVSADGVLELDDEPGFNRRLDQLAGQRVDVIVKRHQSQRSLDQNRLLWLWLTLLADELGYEPHERDRLHYDLLAKRFGMEPRDSGLVLPVKTSSELTVAEMAAYLEWLQRFAAVELSVSLPSPGEVDLAAYDEVTA